MDIKKLLFIFTFLLFSSNLYAQSGKIVGFVTDMNGEPLTGVNVIIEGTVKGTASELDGYYQILNVSAGTHTLRATYIGFTPVIIEDVSVNVDQTTEINIRMQEETIEGAEITVLAEQPVV